MSQIAPPSTDASPQEQFPERKARRRTRTARSHDSESVPFFSRSEEAPDQAHDAALAGAAVLRARVPEHWDSLRSPFRMRLFEAIRASGGCSARDLADALETSCTALYYHLDRLEAAGLIASEAAPVPESERFRGGRRPAIYRACTARLVVECDSASTRDMRRLRKLGESWADERRSESGRMLAREGEEGPEEVEFTRWETLTPDEAAAVRALMAQVEGVLAQARARRETGAGVATTANTVVSCLCARPRGAVFPNPEIGVRVIASTPGHAGSAEGERIPEVP